MKVADLNKIRVCFSCGGLYPKGESKCPYCFCLNKRTKREREWLKTLKEEDEK